MQGGADVSPTNTDNAALYLALKENDIGVIQLLIDYGADINHADAKALRKLKASDDATFAKVFELMRIGKQEKASIFTFVREQREMIPELWDIVMSYTKIPGYFKHVR